VSVPSEATCREMYAGRDILTCRYEVEKLYALARVKIPRYPLRRRFSGIQSRSEHCAKESYFLNLPGMEMLEGRYTD
jgi:hypothetical protein